MSDGKNPLDKSDQIGWMTPEEGGPWSPIYDDQRKKLVGVVFNDNTRFILDKEGRILLIFGAANVEPLNRAVLYALEHGFEWKSESADDLAN
jgi:hypothetical protein